MHRKKVTCRMFKCFEIQEHTWAAQDSHQLGHHICLGLQYPLPQRICVWALCDAVCHPVHKRLA